MADYFDVTHIAIIVPEVRAAEVYYCSLFDLEVAWRDSGGAASMFASWDDLDAILARPEVVMVYRDNLRLALTDEGTGDANGRIDHIGFQVSPEQLCRIRARVTTHELTIVDERDDEVLVFDDLYGLHWELDTRSFADPIAIGRAVEARQQAAKNAR